MAGGEALLGVRMRDAGSGQPAFRQAVHPVPGEPVFLAAALERVVPVPGYLVPEETHRLVIAVHRVIVPVPGDHAGKPSSLLGDGKVPASHDLGFHLLQLCPQPFPVGDPPYPEPSPPGDRADVQLEGLDGVAVMIESIAGGLYYLLVCCR